MNDISIQIIAGIVSTAIFVISYIPMLIKAIKTKDLRSYSFANISLANVGNTVYWLYVVSLPIGPIWGLHAFYTVSTLIMLLCYLNQLRKEKGKEIIREGKL